MKSQLGPCLVDYHHLKMLSSEYKNSNYNVQNKPTDYVCLNQTDHYKQIIIMARFFLILCFSSRLLSN